MKEQVCPGCAVAVFSSRYIVKPLPSVRLQATRYRTAQNATLQFPTLSRQSRQRCSRAKPDAISCLQIQMCVSQRMFLFPSLEYVYFWDQLKICSGSFQRATINRSIHSSRPLISLSPCFCFPFFPSPSRRPSLPISRVIGAHLNLDCS